MYNGLYVSCVIVAAGSGRRMGGIINKVFLPLGSCAVIDYTMNTVAQSELIDEIILVTRADDADEAKKHAEYIKKPVKVIVGGETRQKSVLEGLTAHKSDVVAIHDGARALVTCDIIDRCIEDCAKYRAAAAGVLSKDTLKQIDENGFIEKTLDRATTYQIQTPQVFYYEDILSAHKKAEAEEVEVTDDCALYERYMGRVKITEGSYDNLKLTTPEDMIIAENILKKSNQKEH